jgi:hypothetical protein
MFEEAHYEMSLFRKYHRTLGKDAKKIIKLLNDKDYDKLRTELLRLIQNEDIDEDFFAQQAFMTALNRLVDELAHYYPINEIDPITQDVIEPKDKITLPSGEQFSLTSLVQYHNKRDYRGTLEGEQHNKKYLINPLLNKRFNDDDVKRILATAVKNGVTVNHLQQSQEVVYRQMQNLGCHNVGRLKLYLRPPIRKILPSDAPLPISKASLNFAKKTNDGRLNTYNIKKNNSIGRIEIRAGCPTNAPQVTLILSHEAKNSLRRTNQFIDALSSLHWKRVIKKLQAKRISKRLPMVVTFPERLYQDYNHALTIIATLDEWQILWPKLVKAIKKCEGEALFEKAPELENFFEPGKNKKKSLLTKQLFERAEKIRNSGQKKASSKPVKAESAETAEQPTPAPTRTKRKSKEVPIAPIPAKTYAPAFALARQNAPKTATLEGPAAYTRRKLKATASPAPSF